MEAKIVEQSKNPLLSRSYVVVQAFYDGATPNKVMMRRRVADLCKVKEDLVVVRMATTRFGSREALIRAHVYTDAKALERVERPFRAKRIAKLEEKEKKAQAPAEGAAAA